MAYVGPASRRQGVYCHEHWEAVGYPLLKSNYDYMVRDVFVQATLTETYQAQTNIEREISYIFELPPEASVIGFSAQVGNTRVDSIVEEKIEANTKYEKAREKGDQAWKLEKVNDEIFQIKLGNASPNTAIIIAVTYVYVISSDTIEDSARLTIPAGLAARPGAAPASQTTIPTAPTGTNALTITVGIEAQESSQIFSLNSLLHLASITYGFSNTSFKDMSPSEQQKNYKKSKAYVEFTSNQFLGKHFVLVWTAPKIDVARCIVETLEPAIAGKPATLAFALTLVSNIELDPEEHEYIFLVDNSGSMSGHRNKAANEVVKTMLNQLPKQNKSTFNIYNFTTSAWSILPGGKSVGYDQSSVSSACNMLKTNASGGTDINAALTTVFNQRDNSKPRCSVIVITDGLDWGVTAAMQTVQKNATAAAAQYKLLRVFVVGLGDDVSRGMCEGLARAGYGATVYTSESQLLDKDHQESKATTLINSINRAPIRVRSIQWGVTTLAQSNTSASGNNLQSRSKPNKAELGAAAKGDNLSEPKAIQQAPLPGTMFWGVRSYWYAIINGNIKEKKVTIAYEVPGASHGVKTVEVKYASSTKGRLVHSLAARALIQTFEDKMSSITDPNDKYWNECEIVRLGKTYSLASTQTSFVATMGGVGTLTNVKSNAPTMSKSLLSGVPLNDASGLNFVSTQAPPTAAPTSGAFAVAPNSVAPPGSFAAPTMRLAVSNFSADFPPLEASEPPTEEDSGLSEVIAAQDGNGAFDSNTVERIVFSGSSIPAIPVCISILSGRDSVKDRIWLAICAIAFFEKKHAESSSEWSDARSKAKKFVATTLCCIFGVDSAVSENIFTNALDDAQSYFY